MVERVHADLRRLLPLTTNHMDLSENNWVDALPRVCNLINSNLHAVTKLTPNQIMLGHLNIDSDSTNQAKRWTEVHERIEKAKTKTLKPLAGPFAECTLDTGTPVWLFLNHKEPVPGVVILDKGDTLEVQKMDGTSGRFLQVDIHKSRVSLRC